MKILLTFALCLCAIVAHAANPSTKSFRAVGGLLVTSNDITGIITYDGSGVVASGTNSSMQVSTNGVASATMASNINFTAGNNTVLRGTNIGSTAHINYGMASNLTFNTGLGPVVVGSWGDVWGISNVSLQELAMWLPEVDSSSELHVGHSLVVGGLVTATNVQLTAIPGTGTNVGITAGGTLFRTTISTGSAGTNIGVGQTLYLDKSFGVDATAARTNLVRTFQTPSNSIAAMLSGDTLRVRGGAYPITPKADAVGEPLGWNFQAGVALTNKSNIRIVGEPGAVWYMNSWRSNNLLFSAPMMWLENCTNVTIEGMTFIGLRTNATVLSHGAIVMNSCAHVMVRDCTFSNWQNHAIVSHRDGSTYAVNSHLRFWNNTFANVGGTNHWSLVTDGVAINPSGENVEIVGNRFFNNLRDIEYCCDEDARKVLIYGNTSEGCYYDHIMLTGTNSSEVVIANNVSKGYANFIVPGALADGSTWLKFYAGSNVLVQGNIVGGYANGIISQPTAGTKTIDLQILDNIFHDISIFPVALPSPGNNMVGVNVIYERNTVRGNTFMYSRSSALVVAGNNTTATDNQFIDCNLDAHPRGVITVGHPTAGVATNSTNISIVGNKIVSSAANAGVGIGIYGMCYSNFVYGNEIDRKIATNIYDLGVGTRGRPVNRLVGRMLYVDTNGTEAAVTIGSGAAFDGSTGTLTGTGSGSTQMVAAAIGTLTVTNGIPAPGGIFDVPFNGGGGVFVAAASSAFRYISTAYQLQLSEPTSFGVLAMNGEGYIYQATGGNSALAFGIGTRTNLMINPRGAVIVRPDPSIGTNLFQVEYTNKVPIVFVDSNGVLNTTVGIQNVPTPGSAISGITLFGTNHVQYSKLEAPAVVINTNTHRLWADTNAGVTVAGAVIAGINQLTNITLTAGQVVSHNGTTYVATNAIIGVTNGGNAAAGYIGEHIRAYIASLNAGITSTYFDITNITVTPGDWDVSGMVYVSRNAATGFSAMGGAVSPTAGNSNAGTAGGDNLGFMILTGSEADSEDAITLSIPSWRFNTPTNAVLYLKGYSAYSAGTPLFSGRISARRMR